MIEPQINDIIDQHIDTKVNDLVGSLQTLIRQPSISATGEGITKCAILVHDMLKKAGIHTEILNLDGITAAVAVAAVAPIIYGQIQSKKNPNSKTLLFYNHYDVQPAEPLDQWDDPPFAGIRKGDKVFGRGATDDKGELLTRIKAVEAYLQEIGDVPCNIKFVIEGEEEIGSSHIGAYISKYKEKFACDGIIWEFGYVDAKGNPIISLGMKGLLFVELEATGSIIDAHSSLAAIIKNPAWRLVDALATIRSADDKGVILIKDWYKDVMPLSGMDIQLLQKESFDIDAFKEEFGESSIIKGREGLEAKKSLAAGATCNIAGFLSGYTGKGAKTVLPATATVKLDFRLTPHMDPNVQVSRLEQHLYSKGFKDIKVRVFHMVAPHRTNPSDQFVADVKAAADATFGKSIINISNAGTGPMFDFANGLNAPCVAIGSTYIFSRIHAPNEFAKVDLLKKTTKCMCRIMEKFGSR